MNNNSSMQNTGRSSFIWLTWKLIRGQKLRTAAIFCGLALSCFLLETFTAFGYNFWAQVHEGSEEAAGYDHTQRILLALVTVLLLLIAACSTILLHNLYSLTFARRWRSLTRLMALGTGPRDLMTLTFLENGILYGTAVPSGCLLTLLAINGIGIQSRPPLWLAGGILIWIWAISCLCSIRPLRAALHPTNFHTDEALYKKSGKALHIGKVFCKKPAKTFHRVEALNKKSAEHWRKTASTTNFTRFMTGKYRRANRGHHVRIVLTVLAAILLYVPASYLIETNLFVQRSELEAKHGIQYGCNPQTKAELEEALTECHRLADSSSVVYVSMSAYASVKTDMLSDSLRKMLDAMDWREEAFFSTDAALFFLEDEAYAHFLESADLSPSASAVLIDRYINRSSWSKDTLPSYQELPLLSAQTGSAVNEICGVEIYNRSQEQILLSESDCEADSDSQWNKENPIHPDSLTRQIPEGISFDGKLSLILPLSRLESFLSPRTDCSGLSVCGKFVDSEETSYFQLERILGTDSLGSLRNTRQILREWYASMSGIHRAMTAICSLLFSTAALNIFSMMVFQYMERRRGLAILWSLGQSPGELLKILIREHLRNLSAAILIGIPMSGLLCYYIYKIFRRVWQVTFAFPLRQTALIVSAACVLSLLAVLVEGFLMRRQNFLQDIRNIY